MQTMKLVKRIKSCQGLDFSTAPFVYELRFKSYQDPENVKNSSFVCDVCLRIYQY